MTLPTIPGPTPALPQGATYDQQMRHHEAQMRAFEAQMALLHYEQAERTNAALLAAHGRLAAAQERVADGLPQHLALMQQLLDTPPAPAPAPPAPSSGEGLTAGDVAIVKGIVDAVRPATP